MAAHKIFPHGGPERLSDGVWRIRGGLSFPLHRNMIVLRLPTGELLLHSVVALDVAGLAALEALGTPAYALVPNGAHQMDIAFYKSRYPDLKVLAPAEHRAELEKKVAVAGTVEDVLPALRFTLHKVPGTRDPEYVYQWPLPAGGCMLMANDALSAANSADSSTFMGRTLMRYSGAPGSRLGVARIYRWMMTADLAALKRFIGSLAEVEDLRLVTVSHGDPVTENPAAALRLAAD